jgi:hypothetical protein
MDRTLDKEVTLPSARKLPSVASILYDIALFSLLASCVKTEWLMAGGKHKAEHKIVKRGGG